MRHPKTLSYLHVSPAFFWLVACLLFCTSLTYADEPNINPGINRQYQDPDYQQWVNTFEHEGREVYDRRFDIVKELHLQPGRDVADIGAGTGLFTRLFATAVGPRGKVYAVDISATFIENIQRLAKEQGLHNIIGIVNNPKDTQLKPESIDMAFVCDTYHHFEYPQTTLKSIYQALRPGGQLIIIDFQKDPAVASTWVMSHVRADKTSVIKEIESAGFKLSGEANILTTNYFLKFSRPAVAPVH